MNLYVGVLRWGVAGLGSMVLFLNVALADALDNWTSHTFSGVGVPAICSPSPNAIPKLWKIVFHKGVFVGVGTGPCLQDTPTVILRSADGISWTPGNNPSPFFLYNGFRTMTVSPDVILGAGWEGQRWFSGDGINWGGGYSGQMNWFGAAYGLDHFVVVGENYSGSGSPGPIAYSTNGSWYSASFFGIGGLPTSGFFSVAFGNGTFWAATQTQLFSSSNGERFARLASGAGERILCFGNNRFVRAGNSLYVNTNGTWDLTPWPTANPFEAVSFGAGMFVATSGRDVASSADGFNWTVRTNALPRGVNDMTFGKGFFIAVGNNCPIAECAGEQTNFVSQPVVEMSSAASAGSLWLRGVKNRDYEITAADNVALSNWPVLNRITLTNSPLLWTDPNPATNGQRFYRPSLVP